jgi:c-di-GMP-binding flagellar brake protein YcgR
VNTETADGVLFRSRIEIARILGELARDAVVLAAEFGAGGQLFLSRVLRVVPDEQFLVVAYGQDKQVNNALLREMAVRFRANSGAWRIEFSVREPAETLFEGRGAIRFAFPEALLRSRRREHPRLRVPEDASLRCIADCAGVASFEARIVDISRGGLGGMIHDPGVRLSPGTVLRGCRIVLPGTESVVADLEVRYSIPFAQPDGSLAQRTGVKFLGEPRGLDALLEKFVIEFGDRRADSS